MTQAVARTNKDPLELYMRDVRRFNVLSREEEQELANQWYLEQNLEAAHALVTANLRFVVKVAMEYKSYGLKPIDLIQEGNVGLMHAVRKFDPTRGYRLITYAVWWIRAYIQSYLVKSWSMVKMGTTQAQRKLFFKLRSAEKEMRQLHGHAVDDMSDQERTDQLAEMLGVRPVDVTNMKMRMSARDFSLDVTLDEGSDSTHLDMLEDGGPGTEALVAAREIRGGLKAELAEAIETVLNEREREVIELRHFSDDPPTLREVGERWGVSRERARQIEAAARGKLKKHLLEHGEVVIDAL
jgi:RNA polymerase sigma-32 factor